MMRFIKMTAACSALLLSACASVVATSQGLSKDGSFVYAGTRLNASIISGESCKSTQTENYGCAYDKALAPLSLIDFIPSLALDTLLLPFTAWRTQADRTP
jgi:uncharacterized protein YceK